MNKKYKNTKGITLVALVITIIVLLILAGVSIATLTGDNGLFNKAQSAKEETQEQTALEKVKVAVLGSYGIDGKLDYTLLEENIKKIDGFSEMIPAAFITESSFPLIVVVDDTEIQITKDGNVLLNNILDKKLKELMENPNNFTHPNQSSTNKDRAIGTDGEAVNLDLWSYRVSISFNSYIQQNEGNIILESEATGSYGQKAYLGNIENGLIEGKVPEYIYIYEKNQVYPVTALGRGAFANLMELRTIELPNTLIDIGTCTFFSCSSLEKLTIPNKIEILKKDVNGSAFTIFNGCNALTEITLPISIRRIEEYVFSNCSNLKTVYYKGTKEQFDKINIGTGNAPLLNANLIIKKEEQSVTNKDRGIGTDGEVVNLDLWSYSLVINSEGSDYIVLGQETGGSGAPGAYLGSIIEGKIEGSMPEYIYMYEKDKVYPVTTLGDNAFAGTWELHSIELPNTLTNMGIWVFRGNIKLQSIVIPDKVTEIQSGTFSNCKALTEITLPLSLNEIQSSTFFNCTNLKTVYYKGTKEQFDKINIGIGNESLLNADLITNQ